MNISFVLLEFFSTVLFILCIYHSLKRSKKHLAELLIMVVYAILLESISVTKGGYIYGDFLLKIFGVPIAVGFGWGVIIYTSLATVDKLNISQKIRPFLVTLLALNIDFSMDPIAIKEGLWSFTYTEGFWFGVPSGNFIGWFIVVFCFSYFIYYYRRNQKYKYFYPVLSMIFSIIILTTYGLFQGGVLWYIFCDDKYFFAIFIILIIISIAYILLKIGKIKKDNNVDWIVLFIPAAFHFYFLILLIIRDYRITVLIFVSLVMLISAAYIHLLPYFDILKK